MKVSLSLSDPVPLTANATGKVTVSMCSKRSELTSGSTVLSVDGVAVVALATKAPLWRDLAPGDKGDDVTALQEELKRLGYDVTVDGYYGWWTCVALADLMEKAGGALAQGGVLPLARTLWIPSQKVAVQGCEVRVGHSVSAGGSVATLRAVSVSDVPLDLLPGARTLDFGEFQLATDEGGRVTDPKALERVTGSRLYPGLLAEAKGEGITVDWSLAEQVDVLAVPLALLASFAVVAFLDQPWAWLAAALVWGATGWASVPTLQDALTRTRPKATTTIVAFQMAAMYLGSAVGSAVGTALLGSGTPAGELPVWALGAQAVAVALAVLVGAMGRRAVRARSPGSLSTAAPVECRAG